MIERPSPPCLAEPEGFWTSAFVPISVFAGMSGRAWIAVPACDRRRIVEVVDMNPALSTVRPVGVFGRLTAPLRRFRWH